MTCSLTSPIPAEHPRGPSVSALVRCGAMETRLLIGGELVAGNGPALAVEDPAQVATIAEVGTPDADQLDAAVEAARRAQREWAGTPAAERAEALHEVATRMRERTDELAELMTREAASR
jgi:acyl-CoA reductase-like NAD-dependent aldehyde dehydrogenase